MRPNLTKLFLIIALLLYGCFSHYTPPAKTVDSYYSLMKSGDFEKAKRYLSSKDVEYLKRSQEQGQTDGLSVKIKKAYWNAVRWEVKTHEIKNDYASVTLSLLSPNIGDKMAQNIAHTLMDKNESVETKNSSNIRSAILKDLEQGNYGTIEHDQVVNLIKENDKWKILFDLENAAITQRNLLNALKLGSENKLEEAIIELEKILIVDQGNKIAKEYLEIIKSEMGEGKP